MEKVVYICGAMKDGMTNRQRQYLNRINAFLFLYNSIRENKSGEVFQVDYNEETDKRRKPCTSSYMFTTYNLD